MTYGHRNVQGLAQRRDGSVWSVEHGSYRDDEVNLLRDGGDYGWNPVPGYNEAVPMTDQSLPGPQIDAKWSSGDPTIATSGAAWVRGKQWGRYNGTLAVAALAGNRLVFMKFDKAGALTWTRTPPALRSYGRLRSVTSAANGDLLITTGNGGGSDAVLRVRPQPADPAPRSPLVEEVAQRPSRHHPCRHPHAVQPSQAPPALRTANHNATDASPMSATPRGRRLHQRQAVTKSSSHRASSATTAHGGASRPLAAYRKSEQAISAMPTKGQTEDRRSVLDGLVVPVRVVVPFLVALLDLLQRPAGLLGRGVGPESIGVLAAVAALDRVVLEAEPVLRGLPVRVRHGAETTRERRAGPAARLGWPCGWAGRATA